MIPQKVLKIIQAACRSFLWTGSSGMSKRALVAWESLFYLKLLEAGTLSTSRFGIVQPSANHFGIWLRKKTRLGFSGFMDTTLKIETL